MNNDYSPLLGRVPKGRFVYRKRVSVVIPTFNQATLLAKTLAALEHQTYPRDLIQIVVADDGSADGTARMLAEDRPGLNVRYVRQPDLGHRLAEVVNLGVRASDGDSVILLQADMLPIPRLIEEYMRLLHWIDEALLIGHRRFVDAGALSAAAVSANPEFAADLPDVEPENELWRGDPPQGEVRLDWRLDFYAGNDHLRAERWPFRAVVGSNLAFPRELFDRVGGFSPRFAAWGCEDGEFGYRAYSRGYYFIPVLAATALHQEPAAPRADSGRRAGYEITRSVREDLCPVPPYRKPRAGRRYTVPRVSCALHFASASGEEELPLGNLGEVLGRDAELLIVGGAQVPASVRGSVGRCGLPVRFIDELTSHHGIDDAAREARGVYVGHVPAGALSVLPGGLFERLAECLDAENIGCASARIPDGLAFLYRKRDWWRAGGFGPDADPGQPDAILRALGRVCLCRTIAGEEVGA